MKRFQFMAKHRHEFPLEKMANVFEVSRSGFYQFVNRKESSRKKRDLYLLTKIRESHVASRHTYGRPRILRDLQEWKISCGTSRAIRLMKSSGIMVRKQRKFKVTTDSNHSSPISANLLSRNFNVAEKNRVWVSDITYIETKSGWLYLCLIIDLFSRKIVGWSMKDHMETSLVLSALEMAWLIRRPREGLIFHSDRGSQYASMEFRHRLKEYGMLSSMSRKANCWDNACAESIFSTIKRELVYRRTFVSHAEARHELFDYIEVFYNRQRRHSHINYLSPEEFEKEEVA